MRSTHSALYLTALLVVAAIPGAADGAPMSVSPPSVNMPMASPPQWTLQFNFSVDHIPPQFVAAGAWCEVTTGAPRFVRVGQGEAYRSSTAERIWACCQCPYTS